MSSSELMKIFESQMITKGWSRSTLQEFRREDKYGHPYIQADFEEFKERRKYILDPVVEANRALLHERSQLGIKKYGVTLGEANLSQIELLTHALEEALDLANYLQSEIMRLKNDKAK